MSLTKEISDALCTAITIGYIDLPDRQKYVYESEDDRADHQQLEDILRGLGIDVHFEKQEVGKDKHPVIIARSNYALPQVCEGIYDEVSAIAKDLEAQINRLEFPVPLKGAYIGGMTDGTKMQLTGPSDLYLYPSRYRTVDGSVATAYDRAKTVSNFLIGFLNESLTRVMRYKTISYRQGLTTPFVPIEASYHAGELFASVHGMTSAIVHFSTSMDKNMVCTEISLGRDTCKVASCLPCSLFMWSKGTSATATHLGRGDNWNFPQQGRDIPCIRKWEEDVKKVYAAGMEYLRSFDSNPNVQALMEYTSDKMDELPDIFLEALTFESSFTTKMLATLRA